MEVLIATAKLNGALSSHRALQRRWGADGAKKITLRLQQLTAATTLADLRTLPGRCHELVGDLNGRLAVDIHQPFRLILRPTAEPAPTMADGGLDWHRVDGVTVIDIIDYH